MTHDAAVTKVLEQGGFSVAAAEASGWLDELQKEAVAEAQFLQEEVTIAPTVIGQAAYTVPANAVDVAEVWVEGDTQTTDYQRVASRDLRSVRRGNGSVSRGIFAPQFTSAGVAQIELHPAPTVAALPIKALVAASAPTAGTGIAFVIPEDVHGKLVDGAIALGKVRRDERADFSAVYEVNKAALVRAMVKRRNSRIGSGPARMAVYGIDF